MHQGWRAVAVGLAALLVGCGGGSAPGEAVDTLALSFASDDGGDLDEETSRCVARAFVVLISGPTFGVLSVPAAQLADADLEELEVDDDDVVELFEDCDVDLGDVDAEGRRGLTGDALEVALDDAYRGAFGGVLEANDDIDDMDRRGAACLAGVIVDGIGLDALLDAARLGDVDDADDLAELDIDVADEIDNISADASDCDVDLSPIAEDVLGEALAFSGAAEIDCMMEALGEELVFQVGIAGLLLGVQQAANDPAVFDGSFSELEDALFDCVGDFFEDLPEIEAEEADYVAALTGALAGDPGLPFAPAPAECVAQDWISGLGEEFFPFELGVEPEALGDLDALSELGLVFEEVEGLVDAAATCAVPVHDLALTLLDTAPLTPEQVACFAFAVVDGETVGEYVAGFVSGELDPQSDANLAVSAAISTCVIE